MSNPINVHVAVVYHSGYGHTAKHAEAAAFGAKNTGAKALLINVDDINEYCGPRKETADSVQIMTVNSICTDRSYGNP